jgi:hypothetical protein
MSAATIEMLERAAEALGPLVDEVAFVGGATIALWATDPASAEFRPTEDVDVIVEVTTRPAYYRFEERLREVGFVNDVESRIACRFLHSGKQLVLDAMPTDGSVLGFENRWQREAFPHAEAVDLPSGRTIKAVPPPFLVATKLEAFRSRGEGDLFASPDFEDVITLIDRREELVEELTLAPAGLRGFVAGELGDLLAHPDFDPAGEGALAGGPETQARFEQIVKPRIEKIVEGAGLAG